MACPYPPTIPTNTAPEEVLTNKLNTAVSAHLQGVMQAGLQISDLLKLTPENALAAAKFAFAKTGQALKDKDDAKFQTMCLVAITHLMVSMHNKGVL